MNKKNYKDSVSTKVRLVVSLVIIVVIFIGLIGRLSYVMVGGKVNGKNLKAQAIAQWTSEVKISAKRGRILDRNLRELAVSANVYRIDADLNTLRDFQRKNKVTTEEIAKKLSEILNLEEPKVLKNISSKYGAAIIKRRVEKEEADKVEALGYTGMIISPDVKRYYPNNNLLSHVIGHTNSDGDGLTGVELVYNKELSGKPGVRIAETDRRMGDLPYTISDFTKPIDGKDVVLTIDEMIQYFADKAASEALKNNKAKAVTVMVMDPRNGEVLALANKPDYNLNDPWVEGISFDELQKSWRNRAVSDAYEPGSIFKVVTAITALMENKVNPAKDIFNCGGSDTVLGSTFHCWKTSGHGPQSFQDILKNSCNVGFGEVARRIGKEKFNEYIKNLGFGKKTGIDLPGEGAGVIKDTKTMTDLDLSIIGFGQVNAMTPMQYMTAFNAVANGGKWIRPHVMKGISHYDENSKEQKLDKNYDNFGERQVLDKDKTTELRGYLEKVVSEGGGHRSFVEGYTIAGKTGTAQKIRPDGRGYDTGKYISSFAGMAPAENPIFTVLVQIDEPDPTNYYAGQIAAPVGKNLCEDLFNYLSLKGTHEGDLGANLIKNVVVPEIRGMKKDEAIKILKENKLKYEVQGEGQYIVEMNPKPGYSIKEGSKIILYTGDTTNYNKVVVVPNLMGLTPERATEILNGLGLEIKIYSEGIVSKQSIEPGKEVEKGATIAVESEVIGD